MVCAKHKNGRGMAGLAYGNKIVLDNKTGLNEYTLLHEMAHCAGHRHHGRSFRVCLLKLVGQFMGRKERDTLKAEFRAARLACGRSRSPLSYDKWLEKYEHMRKVRGE